MCFSVSIVRSESLMRSGTLNRGSFASPGIHAGTGHAAAAGPLLNSKDDTASVNARGDAGFLLGELRDAIDRLPDKERSALLLREVEGLETEEVAVRLGSTAVTVRSQISRARARLRVWLGGNA